jgi:penicillin-binding protein 1A
VLLQRLWAAVRWLWRLVRKSYKIVVMTIALPLTGMVTLGGIVVFYKLYIQSYEKPDLQRFFDFTPPAAGTFYDTRGDELLSLAVEYRTVIRYDEIPPVLEHALMAAEDKRFWNHGGIDWRANLRAAWNVFEASVNGSIHSGRPRLVFTQGASTLDQQLVKLLLVPELMAQERSSHSKDKLWKLNRKIHEMRLAMWMNRELEKAYGSKRKAKEEILSRYMSLVYLGHSYRSPDQGRYGFKAAAQYYFGKNLSDITVPEAALLAGMIKSPTRYAPKPDEEHNKLVAKRRNEVIDLMLRAQFIAPDSVALFKEQPLVVPAKIRFTTIAPHAVGSAIRELRKIGFSADSVAVGAYNPHLTTDRRIQAIVNEALDSGLAVYQARHPEATMRAQGAVIVLRNSDAAVLAEAGGRFNDGDSVYARYTDFNRATQAVRQPGSSFKPVVYTTALTHGWKFESLVNDAPICVRMGAGRPQKCISNYDGKYKGWIPLRQCLSESRNACTVWLARRLELQNILDLAQAAGITTELEKYPTTALGASAVRLIDLANVFRTLTTGYYVEPYRVSTITNRRDSVIYRVPERERVTVFSDTVATIVQELLRSPVRLPHGTAAALDNTRMGFPVQVMGKTGTTNDFRDARFIGVTPGPEGIVIAIWIGVDNYQTLGEKESGARIAIPIFAQIVKRLIADSVITVWPQMPEAVEHNIDRYLGKTVPVDVKK